MGHEPQPLQVLTVEPIAHASGQVRLPGSKSISNRALLLAALSPQRTELTGLLQADDTRVMIEALRALGVAVETEADRTVVSGCGGHFPRREADLFPRARSRREICIGPPRRFRKPPDHAL